MADRKPSRLVQVNSQRIAKDVPQLDPGDPFRRNR